MKTGDRFLINGTECAYCGRFSFYEDGSGPMMDVISIPSILLPSGKPVTFSYKPGTWEHRIENERLPH